MPRTRPAHPAGSPPAGRAGQQRIVLRVPDRHRNGIAGRDDHRGGLFLPGSSHSPAGPRPASGDEGQAVGRHLIDAEIGWHLLPGPITGWRPALPIAGRHRAACLQAARTRHRISAPARRMIMTASPPGPFPAPPRMSVHSGPGPGGGAGSGPGAAGVTLPASRGAFNRRPPSAPAFAGGEVADWCQARGAGGGWPQDMGARPPCPAVFKGAMRPERRESGAPAESLGGGIDLPAHGGLHRFL